MSFSTIWGFVVGWWGLGTVLTVLAIVGAFILSGTLRSICVVAAISIAAGTALGAWQFKVGYDRALHDVAAQDARAVAAAAAARERVRECRDSGGTWNTETGQCDRS